MELNLQNISYDRSRLLLLSNLLLAALSILVSGIHGSVAESSVWLPEGLSMEDWKSCHGMSHNSCISQKTKLQELRQKLSQSQPETLHDLDPTISLPHFTDTLDGCIIPTEQQLDRMLQALNPNNNSGTGKVRRKRKISDFSLSPQDKWDLPIYYKFDGTHDEAQKRIIRDAFRHWMDNTCVRFIELPMYFVFNTHHVVFTNNDSRSERCFSYVGRVSFWPQKINLHDSCLYRFGTVVHEIGHTLGLWHEQTRRDRDEWINIKWENIIPGYAPLFFSNYSTVSLGLPYDFGSVMQYSSLEGVSMNGRDTMLTKDPLYQQNMGQRTGLSFGDRKVINLAYCKGVCFSPLPQPCERGGYQDPNDCSRCICTDGFSGRFCETVASSVNADCGGRVDLLTYTGHTITSPGYQSVGHYWSHQQCSWLIKAPRGHKVHLKFEEEFGLYCVDRSCYHWVEVKYKVDLGKEGGRFCCYQRPSVTVTSEGEEMMIIFNSNFTLNYLTAQRGFKAVLTAVPDPNYRPETSTTLRTPTTEAFDRMDLALLIDSTAATNSPGWSSTRLFTADLLRRLDVAPDGDHVAILTFGSSISTVSPLTHSYDLEQILAAMARSSQAGLPNSISLAPAIRLARSHIYRGDGSSRVRPGVQNVCLIVALGERPLSDVNGAVSEAMEARREGIRLMILTKESVLSRSSAESLVGSRKYVFFIEDLMSGHNMVAASQSYALSTYFLSTFYKPIRTKLEAVPDLLWQCSFEVGGVTDPLCGMTQEMNDQFDWTIYSGATPSEPTGPNNAYHGKYYIYIEASTPRRRNDQASLLLPQFDTYRGHACLDFYYHMFGYHVRSLWISEESAHASRQILWRRDKEQGNRWYRGFVHININPQIRLRFESSRGDEFSGDIALDRIRITPGNCV